MWSIFRRIGVNYGWEDLRYVKQQLEQGCVMQSRTADQFNTDQAFIHSYAIAHTIDHSILSSDYNKRGPLSPLSSVIISLNI